MTSDTKNKTTSPKLEKKNLGGKKQKQRMDLPKMFQGRKTKHISVIETEK